MKRYTRDRSRPCKWNHIKWFYTVRYTKLLMAYRLFIYMQHFLLHNLVKRCIRAIGHRWAQVELGPELQQHGCLRSESSAVGAVYWAEASWAEPMLTGKSFGKLFKTRNIYCKQIARVYMLFLQVLAGHHVMYIIARSKTPWAASWKASWPRQETWGNWCVNSRPSTRIQRLFSVSFYMGCLMPSTKSYKYNPSFSNNQSQPLQVKRTTASSQPRCVTTLEAEIKKVDAQYDLCNEAWAKGEADKFKTPELPDLE